jgi:hypothetical protein
LVEGNGFAGDGCQRRLLIERRSAEGSLADRASMDDLGNLSLSIADLDIVA